MNSKTEKALAESYEELLPYSKTYRVDKERYAFSLARILSIPEIAQKRVLDIGTGIGLTLVALRKLGVEANGVDRFIFPDAGNAMFGRAHIEELKKVWAHYGIAVHNTDILNAETARRLPQADVIMNEALIEHLKDPRSFLKTCHALLTPGGYLLLATPNGATLLKRIRFLFGKSPNWPIESFFSDGDTFTGHWREYTMKELVYMCEATGFTVLETYSKNHLTRFKSLTDWRKNLRALVAALGVLLPRGREMNYVLCRKE
jgi:2-polyprenyl-3-methyl-5-hydroxy-6-metoxy-1,4-benzoquinol methylase